MSTFIKLYCMALPIFFAVDMVWLGIVAKNFYGKYLGYIMTPSVNWLAAVVFYVLFIAGLVVFVITPGVENGSWQRVVVTGAFFGLVTYATYDLTNLATIKNWPLIVTAVDLAWGMALSALVCVITFFVAKKFGV